MLKLRSHHLDYLPKLIVLFWESLDATSVIREIKWVVHWYENQVECKNWQLTFASTIDLTYAWNFNLNNSNIR